MSSMPYIEVSEESGAAVSLLPQSAEVKEQPSQAGRIFEEALKHFAGGQWSTRLAFVATDALVFMTALLLLQIIVRLAAPELLFSAQQMLLATVPIVGIGFGLAGLYEAAVMHPAEELRRTGLITVGIALGGCFLLMLAGSALAQVALWAVLGSALFVLFLLFRAIARILLSRTDWWGVPVLVVGSEKAGRNVLKMLDRWPALGMRPVAFLSEEEVDKNMDVKGRTYSMAPVIGEEYGIPYAIFAGPDLSYRELAMLLDRQGKYFHRIFVVPEAATVQGLWNTGCSYDGLQGIGVQHYTWRTGARRSKRAFDFVAALLGCLLLTPLLVTVAILIKLDSSGPVFFRQERMGRKGRCFRVIKFRTMYQDAEERLQEILETDPERRAEYQRYHKLQDDPRVTRIGKWLRRYSIDELPQLVNVLKGEMSLVGPRAYLPNELPKMNGLSRAVLQSPPGLTGLWQVSGRNQLSFEERVDLDVHYMQNWSPWLDLYILAKTAPVVVNGEGAH